MHISQIGADYDAFRTVQLDRRFNVVLADRQPTSGPRDSRNGVGKSTLVEIVQFVLGASRDDLPTLRAAAVEGRSFYLAFEGDTRLTRASRSIDQPGTVIVEGQTHALPVTPVVTSEGELGYSVRDWTKMLGLLWYGLNPEDDEKYRPTFRSLIAYAARRGRDAFSTPFETHRRTQDWARQVLNAYLLGLDPGLPAELQELRDRRNLLEKIRRGAAGGLVHGLAGTRGELEAERVRLESETRRQKADLDSFQVHPQYRDIETEAASITEQVHVLSNENVIERELLDAYRQAESTEPSATNARAIAQLYEEASAVLPVAVRRTLSEVEQFHSQVLQNRRQFLAEEVRGFEQSLAARAVAIRQHSERRATLLSILQTHGALEEYASLQEEYARSLARVSEITHRIDLMREFQEGEALVRLELTQLGQRAMISYEELRELWERAVARFNEYSQVLYQSPGDLVIEAGEQGYRFEVEIQRSGSGGVGNMKIFLYDLTIASLLAERSLGPGFLIHDSLVFDGVDERQVAGALQLARTASEASGFQYLCLLNSDQVPAADLPPDFGLARYVRLTLNDDPPEASLLGSRF